MPIYSFMYSIPYITFFFCLYLAVIPITGKNTVLFYNTKYNFLQIFTVFVLLIVFFGFRGYLYSDWQSYYAGYNDSPSFFDGTAVIRKYLNDNFWEKGFLFFLIFCKTISKNYFFLQFTSAFIDLILLYCCFKEYIPKHIALGYLFFFLFSGITIEFNLLRNSKSMLIFLLSIKYIEQRKMVKYFLLNALGCLFHISALLYFPLYFLLNKKYSQILLFILFCLGNLIYIFQIEWCRNILIILGSFIPGLGNKIYGYITLGGMFSKSYGISIGYIERFFSFLLIYCYSAKLYNLKRCGIIFVNIFYLYSFVFLYFSEISILLERVSILFIVSYWILYPQIYSIFSKTYKKIFLLFLLTYGFLKLLAGNGGIWFIYDNILFQYKTVQERKFIIDHYEYVRK
jgi:hypothetical protein